MKFSISVTKGSRNKLAGLAQRLRNLGPAYARSSVVVISSAQMHIRSQNGGTWPPTAENATGAPLFRTGALMRSIVATPIDNGVKVGTNLTTPSGGYNIGRLMQYGTRPIEARNAKVLCFEINGVKIFAKRTKGIPPRPFLYFDTDTAQRVLGVFESYLIGDNNDA